MITFSGSSNSLRLKEGIRDGKGQTSSHMRHVVSDMIHPNRLILDIL